MAIRAHPRRGQIAIEQNPLRQRVRINLQVFPAAVYCAIQIRLRRAALFVWIRYRRRRVLPSYEATTGEVLLFRNPRFFHCRVDIAGEQLSKVRMAHMQWTSAIESKWVRRRWYACVCGAHFSICGRIGDSTREERQSVFESPAIIIDEVRPLLVRSGRSTIVDHGIEC